MVTEVCVYSQSTGEIRSGDGLLLGKGYSGDAEHYNQPASQSVHGEGPIPRGRWVIGAFFDDIGGKGPVVCHLSPAPGTETFGRSGFMIHGDNRDMNRTASHGCIILPRTVRTLIARSGDPLLTVEL